ncbi:hypothetical protein WA026_019100 [Henosepilachna vigintioctopunctata]|uniref:Gustatory receptor n=1 Tax=Henosepilachna vigintioctopunctata TaxID=420089 RepID=A0AAW1VG32_9CUCU
MSFAWMNIFSIKFSEKINPILEILHKINSTGLYISSMAIVLKITFRVTKKYQKFIRTMWKMNEILQTPWMNSNNLVYIFVTYFLCLFISLVESDYGAYNQDGYLYICSILLELFQSIQGTLYISTSICLVQCLKFQYATIIDKLLKNEKMYVNCASKQIVTYIGVDINPKNLEGIIRLHEQICDLVDDFNSIFGSNFLLVVFDTAMSILLYTSNFAMIILNHTQGELLTTFQRCISIGLSLVLMIALAHECSGTVAKGKLLVAACLSYCNTLSLKQKCYETEQFEKYISILCHQAETRKPHFTAGGFFTIDYTMLTMIAANLFDLDENLNIPWMQFNNLSYIFIPYVLGIFALIIQSWYAVCVGYGCLLTLSFFLETLQTIHVSLFLSVSICLVECLNARYEAIINKLPKCGKAKKKWIAFRMEEKFYLKTDFHSENLESLIRSHEKLCDLVDDFNSLFGLSIFFGISSITLLTLLHSSYFSMYVLITEGKFLQYGIGNVLLKFTNIVILMPFPILLAHQCSSALKNEEELIAACLSFSNQLPKERRTFEIELLEKGSYILCRQAQIRRLRFDAGGFFIIDHRMLHMILGALAAYMIIILQIVQSNNIACKI